MSATPGIDSAQALTDEMISASASVLRSPVGVRVVYLDAFAGGRAEVALAHAHGAAVVLCCNSTTTGLVAGTLEDGLRYGEGQCMLAADLGAPRGTLVAVDIEASYQPSEAWLGGVVTGIVERGYTPCVYGALTAPGTANALLAAHLHWLAVREHLVLWSATPCVQSGGPWYRDVPWVWDADRLPGFATVGWQFAEGITLPGNGGAVDLDLWQDATPGLWRAPTNVAPLSHTHPSPDVAAIATSLDAAERAIQAAQAALQQ